MGILWLLAAAPAGQDSQPVTIYLIGDSTMADKPLEGNPERGWGQALPFFFDGGASVSNHAMNGRSSKSFIDEGRWTAVLAQLKAKDYVFIQFGHNDEKQEDPARYTDPQSTFQRNLERFVTEVRGKDATPVLLTPVMRRRFDKEGYFYDTHGKYPDAVRQAAREQKTALIDLHALTEKLIVKLGEDGSKKLFLWIPPGQYMACPDGRQDDTHFSAFGATEVARLVTDEIRRQEIPIRQYLKESPAAAQSIASRGRYLFAYFIANGQDGLHLAFSEDGLKWQDLTGYRSRIVPQAGSDKLMRDPFILEGPDGLFHMVWTVSWKERGIGYAFSKDLLTWSEQKYLPVMEHEPMARNCWAPEMVYDDEKAQYLIFWATTIPGRFPQTDGQNSKGPGGSTRESYAQSLPVPVSAAALSSFDRYHKAVNTLEDQYRRMGEFFSKRILLASAVPDRMPVKGYVSGPMGQREDPFDGSTTEHHSGLDISAPYGSPIRAPAEGVVNYAGQYEGYGKLVIIDHRFGIVTRYGHLSRMIVRVGQRVSRSEVIGYVGTTGRTTGPHLHYEVLQHNVRQNPQQFFSHSD